MHVGDEGVIQGQAIMRACDGEEAMENGSACEKEREKKGMLAKVEKIHT
jgi:hypothetical protein